MSSLQSLCLLNKTDIKVFLNYSQYLLTNGKKLQQYAKKPLRQMQVAQATKRLYSWVLMEISVVRLALTSCRKLDGEKNTKKETCKHE